MTDSTHPGAADPSPSIRQEIKGDHNQVIGQMLGGIVVNNLTIYERPPATAIPPPVSGAQSLTQQEYRQRQVMLNKVKGYWIEGALKKSLHTTALIELGLQDRPDLVPQPFHVADEFGATPGQTLPEGVSAHTIFEQIGMGRTLLIVGEPGSGKTTALLKLAEDLVTHTEQDLSQPIPVVLNLSSWSKKQKTIDEWLIWELQKKYQVSKALGKTWVETEALILLLDGLDEVKAEQRDTCVQALQQFMQNHGTTELAICCRIRDYEALTEKLNLRSAICIQPLTSIQVNEYIEQAGERLSALKAVLQQDEDLQALATTPLILSIMSLAYQDCTPEEIALHDNTKNYRKHIFNSYIKRMLRRRKATQQYSEEKTLQWLIWLAQRMTVVSQTVFLIEQLQPSWLPTKGQQFQYRLESGLIAGLIVGMISGFGEGLISGLYDALTIGPREGLIIGIFFGFLGDIKPIETLKWSWRELKIGLRSGLMVGLMSGLMVRLFGGLRNSLKGGPIAGLILVLVIVSFGGLMGALIGGFRGAEIQHRVKPNQGIFQSARNAVIIGMCVVLIIGLMSRLTVGTNVTLTFGPIFGLIGVLMGGGSACIRHLALRQMLCRCGYAPWDYAHFLDNAADRLFLQKVGGGYIFWHRMLLEHFAAMSPPSESLLTKGGSNSLSVEKGISEDNVRGV
jgi:adenylate kinase family enzyme